MLSSILNKLIKPLKPKIKMKTIFEIISIIGIIFFTSCGDNEKELNAYTQKRHTIDSIAQYKLYNRFSFTQIDDHNYCDKKMNMFHKEITYYVTVDTVGLIKLGICLNSEEIHKNIELFCKTITNTDYPPVTGYSQTKEVYFLKVNQRFPMCDFSTKYNNHNDETETAWNEKYGKYVMGYYFLGGTNKGILSDQF